MSYFEMAPEWVILPVRRHYLRSAAEKSCGMGCACLPPFCGCRQPAGTAPAARFYPFAGIFSFLIGVSRFLRSESADPRSFYPALPGRRNVLKKRTFLSFQASRGHAAYNRRERAEHYHLH
jgi:hypothetical protein